MNNIEQIIEHPVIGAVGLGHKIDYKHVPCEVFFIVAGDIMILKSMIDDVKKANKHVFVHVDLIKGLKADTAGLKLVKSFEPTGIITTKSNLIKEARKLGLLTIQRLFLLDSKNLESGVLSVKNNQPDAIEILPGTVHKATAEICRKVKIPVITGGLIKDKEDIIESLRAGAIAVSTSSEKLWNL